MLLWHLHVRVKAKQLCTENGKVGWQPASVLQNVGQFSPFLMSESWAVRWRIPRFGLLGCSWNLATVSKLLERFAHAHQITLQELKQILSPTAKLYHPGLLPPTKAVAQTKVQTFKLNVESDIIMCPAYPASPLIGHSSDLGWLVVLQSSKPCTDISVLPQMCNGNTFNMPLFRGDGLLNYINAGRLRV